MLEGQETAVLGFRTDTEAFPEVVERHHGLQVKRGHALSADVLQPSGQAAGWYQDVIRCVPWSGQVVAHQIARLCGDDSVCSVPIRSLADAVGQRDRAGRQVALTERGIEVLVESGWLRTEVTGRGQNIVTTYYLMPGPIGVEWFTDDEDAWQEDRLALN